MNSNDSNFKFDWVYIYIYIELLKLQFNIPTKSLYIDRNDEKSIHIDCFSGYFLFIFVKNIFESYDFKAYVTSLYAWSSLWTLIPLDIHTHSLRLETNSCFSLCIFLFELTYTKFDFSWILNISPPREQKVATIDQRGPPQIWLLWQFTMLFWSRKGPFSLRLLKP